MKTNNPHKAKHRTLPKKLLSISLAVATLFMSVPFAFTSFAKNSDTNYTTSKANVLEQKLSAENKNLPSGANDFKLTAEVDQSLNNGNGAVNLDWSSYDSTDSDIFFKGYQSKNEGETYENISLVNYDTVDEIKVLNIYPTETAGFGALTMPKISFTSVVDGNKSYTNWYKSASLKAWMEQKTAEAPKGYGNGKIRVDVVSISAFNNNPTSPTIYKSSLGVSEAGSIYDYDVIFLGSWDGNGLQYFNETATNVISEYIDKGYGFIAGHDTIGCHWGSSGISGLREKFNIKIGHWLIDSINDDYDYNNIWGYSSSQVKITKKGLFTTYPWNIGEVGDILNIPTSHTTSNSAGADVWLELTNGSYTNPVGGSYWGSQPTELANDGYNDKFYLTTNNNVAMIQTGHSNGDATADEQKIIANLIFYLCQMSFDKNVTDYSAMDVTPPEKPIVGLTKNADNIGISLSSIDNGTSYKHYVQAFNKNDASEPLATSNVTTSTVKSGLKGYYYVIDGNATNDFNVSTAKFTADGNITADYAANTYIHVKSVDKSGNVSAVTDTMLEPLKVEFVHKVYSVADGSITDLNKTPDMRDLPSMVGSGDKIDLTNSKIYTGETEYNYNHAPTCDGYIFMGWYLDEKLTIPAYQKDEIINVTGNQTFYAKWIPVGTINIAKGDIYTLEREIGTKKPGFELYGVQIRFKDYANGGKGMRFVTRMRTALLDEIRQATGNDDVTYGYMMKTQVSFAEKCNYDPVRMSEFEANLNGGKYADFGDYFLYTGVITNIKEEKFDTNFSAAAYIKYTDANGVERSGPMSIKWTRKSEKLINRSFSLIR